MKKVDEVVNKYLGKGYTIPNIVDNFASTFVEEIENTIHRCDIPCVENGTINGGEQQLQSMYVPPERDESH